MHIFKIPAGITKMYLEVNGMKMHIDFAEAGTDKTVEVIWQDNNVAVRPGAGGMGGGAVRPDKPFKDCVPVSMGRGDGYYTAGLSNGKDVLWMEIEPVFGTEKEAIERAEFVRNNN